MIILRVIFLLGTVVLQVWTWRIHRRIKRMLDADASWKVMERCSR